ncbi:hypothetical protein PI124_g18567 [Phytophthora idaei]|nr:hypothetical protein PI126_g17839 [Phytophthora idaei]KAG3236424.1 hypothetical protein PI124_g18567 [Phytophthora idaei]
MVSTASDEKVERMLMQMQDDVSVHDSERAAIYVATVRAAMAVARDVRTDVTVKHQEDKRQRRDDHRVDERRDGEGASPEEAEVDTAKKVNDGEKDDETAGSVASAGEGAIISSNALVTESVTLAKENRGEGPDVLTDVLDEDNIAQVRLARRRARKQAKRQMVKRVPAQRREHARQTEAEHLRTAQRQLAERRRVADEVVQEMEQRRRQQPSNHVARNGDSARVSLVQRRRTSERSDRVSHEAESVEYIEADDGLPTAMMTVAGNRRHIKFDSCARFTVAGKKRMQYGDKIKCRAPVDYVEGIGRFLLDVIGEWRFEMRSTLDEILTVDACVVAGCMDEFLLGVDFMQKKGAVMDFHKSELRYKEAEKSVVIPFKTYGGGGSARIAVVRMASKGQIEGSIVTPVEVAVPAEDSEQGICIPTK